MTNNEESSVVEKEDQPLASQTLSEQLESSVQAKNCKRSRQALNVALVALILLVVNVTVAVYLYQERVALNMRQQVEIIKLGDQLSAQKNSQNQQLQKNSALKSELTAQVEQVNLQLQQLKNANKLYQTDIQALQRVVAESRVRHPNDWILAEVEYLVTLAGRKIWLERDIASAIALLLAADQRILELHDTSLSGLRAALLDDINNLEALPKRDLDGLMLGLADLERRIDKLVIAGVQVAGGGNKSEIEISSDINDWQENLVKSWDIFVNSIIVINKREAKIQALLSPQQSWYLKENVRNHLAKAEFAVYREQQEIFDLALLNATDLLKNYYDLNDGATNHFYSTIEALAERKISVNYPDQLKSAPLLERIIKQRVKKSLVSSRAE